MALTKDQKEILTRAAKMYTNATGEDANSIVASLPVQDSDAEKKAAEKKRAEDHKRQVELQRKVEETEQAQRRAANEAAKG